MSVQVDQFNLLHTNPVSDGVHIGSPRTRDQFDTELLQGSPDVSLDIAEWAGGCTGRDERESGHNRTISAGPARVNSRPELLLRAAA